MWKKVGSGTPGVAFPIYDGHGNMVYTLSRGANDTFSLGNKRIYGVWGDLRYDGNPNAGPNTQYCANLGHKLDNESGLTYMRARYYEPWTGRFVSEDPAKDGWNWYVYCDNNPVLKIDISGESAVSAFSFAIAVFFYMLTRYDNSGSLLKDGARFVEAIICALGTYVLNSPGLEKWTSKAALEFLRGFGFAHGVNIDKAWGPRMKEVMRTCLVVSFYVGYTMFLYFAMAELDAFVEGYLP